MTATDRGGRFYVAEGAPAFLIASSLCNYFELGEKAGSDYWLEGEIAAATDFVFNGRLFLPGGSASGTIIDNFPKGPAPDGWTKRPLLTGEGYELVAGEVSLFGYEVLTDRVCKVAVKIFAMDGQVVAESTATDFVVRRGPGNVGRGENGKAGMHFGKRFGR
jgi:hypothetical protein